MLGSSLNELTRWPKSSDAPCTQMSNPFDRDPEADLSPRSGLILLTNDSMTNQLMVCYPTTSVKKRCANLNPGFGWTQIQDLTIDVDALITTPSFRVFVSNSDSSFVACILSQDYTCNPAKPLK